MLVDVLSPAEWLVLEQFKDGVARVQFGAQGKAFVKSLQARGFLTDEAEPVPTSMGAAYLRKYGP